MKLTDWYSPNIKPKRKGVYITRYYGAIYFQRWTGRCWNVRMGTINSADEATHKSRYQNVEWKGIQK